MKPLIAILFTSAALFAQCNSIEHFQTANIDAYVGFTQTEPPQVPGSLPARCRVAVSLDTTDMDSVAFAVYLQMQLPDGSMVIALNKTVQRVTIFGVRTIVEATIPGPLMPQSIVRFDVTRLHSMPNDTLVCLQCGH